MQIQGIWQTIATQPHQSANKSSPSNPITSDELSNSNGITQSEPAIRSIDMHNISPNEYNELVRAGLAELPVPMLLPGGRVHLDGQQAEMGDVKMDYIAQIEQSMKYSQSIGDSEGVDFLRMRLSIVKELHGNEYAVQESNKGINTTA